MRMSSDLFFLYFIFKKANIRIFIEQEFFLEFVDIRFNDFDIFVYRLAVFGIFKVGYVVNRSAAFFGFWNK